MLAHSACSFALVGRCRIGETAHRILERGLRRLEDVTDRKLQAWR